MNEQIEEMLAVYALGGLSHQEEAEVDAYIAENPHAAALLEKAYASVSLLPYVASPLEPSAAAEAALFARIEADLALQAGPVQATAVSRPRPSQPKPTIWDTLHAFFSMPLVTAVSLGTAVLILFWGLSLNRQVRELEQNVQQLTADNSSLRTDLDVISNENISLIARVSELQSANQAYNQQIDDMAQNNAELIAANNSLETEVTQTSANLAALEASRAALEGELANILTAIPFNSSDVYSVTLPGTEEQPNASAQLVIDPVTNTALLLVDSMPALPEGAVYQVLLIRGAEHETAETFRVDTEGEGVLLVQSTEPLQSFDAVGVSIEPEGGSVQRTGDIVLLGSIIN